VSVECFWVTWVPCCPSTGAPALMTCRRSWDRYDQQWRTCHRVSSNILASYQSSSMASRRQRRFLSTTIQTTVGTLYDERGFQFAALIFHSLTCLDSDMVMLGHCMAASTKQKKIHIQAQMSGALYSSSCLYISLENISQYYGVVIELVQARIMICSAELEYAN